MTDPFTLGVAVLTAGVATWAAWLHRPASVDFDDGRFFALTLATLLRGRIEADGGDAAAWEAAVGRVVKWHPWVRRPEVLIAAADLGAVDGAGPRQHALAARLAALPDAGARWAALADDPDGVAARLGDPAELGHGLDPARVDPALSWDRIAAWGGGDAAVGAIVRERLGAAWVVVGGGPVLDALVDEGPGARCAPDGLGAALDAALAGPRRPVVVVFSEGVGAVLDALAARPTLRDRLVAVVAVGARLQGAEVDDAVGHAFSHEALDTELHRATPYAALGLVDGVPLAEARWPKPAGSDDLSAVAAIDLAAVDVGAHAVLVARAIALWAAMWAARQP